MSLLLKPPVPTSRQRRLSWHQLYGSAAALALAEATRSDQRLYVVVTDDARELERLSSELQFFAGDRLPLLTLPDWEVLPYDLFSPHPDITSQRLRTLFELPRVKDGWLPDVLARLQIRYREIPIVFADSRKFAEEWTYRFLATALADLGAVSDPRAKIPT